MLDDQNRFHSRRALSCAEVEEQLNRYLDDEMAEEEEYRFTAHLNSCECCRSMAEDCRHMLDTARSLADIPIPPAVSSRLRQRLEEELHLRFGDGKPYLYLVK